MTESLEIPSFWIGGGVGETGVFSHDLLTGDGLDGLFDDLTSDLLFKPNDAASLDAGSALGDFEDWLDLKMDFSLLDCTEGQNNALNDPLVMEKVHGSDLATPEVEKQTIMVNVSKDLSSYTPPSSPESQVPDVNRSINVANLSRDHNLFASPPESPNRSSDSFVNSFLQPAVAPSCLVEVVMEDAASVTQVQTPVEAPHFVYVTRQRDPRPVEKNRHPYTRSESKAATSSVLKLKVKSASGSSSRTTHVVKKERKRAQNKDAATRYREKKRLACKYLESEEDVLEAANQNLKTKIKEISTEITYLKGFMRDMFRARGLLK